MGTITECLEGLWVYGGGLVVNGGFLSVVVNELDCLLVGMLDVALHLLMFVRSSSRALTC